MDAYVKNWLIKAEHDLKVVVNELKIPPQDMVTDIICFHCQQAVEIRYPDEFYLPTPQEAQACFELAQTIQSFVLAKIQ